jgi:hypothetical protein
MVAAGVFRVVLVIANTCLELSICAPAYRSRVPTPIRRKAIARPAEA